MKFAFVLVMLPAAIAAAEPNDSARASFERGQAALKAGRVHEACDAFAASEKLAASTDTEASLASCYERDGKPASAARVYRTLAGRDTAREKTWTAKAAKLEAKAPKLRFAISPMPPGLVVKVDGLQVSATEDVLVDTGPHEVIATAPGYEGRASAPVDREGAILDVIIRLQAKPQEAAPMKEPAMPAPMAKESAPAPMAEAPMEAEASVGHRRRNGFIVGAVGLGVLVGAGVTFGVSVSKLDDYRALCPDSMCSSQANLDQANSLISDARTLRGVSIGMGIGSGVLLAAGAYLVITGDSHVSLHADASGAGVTYTARF